MARQMAPVCRLCRREGEKLFLKGDKCYSDKCPVERRPYAPGQHGRERKKMSDYALHLREKQKLRRIYGVLERQFRRYYYNAARKKGVTGEVLLQALEMRLDNILYRLGFAASRAQARQLVTHGHFTVNGRKVDIPSYGTRPGDVIAPRPASRDLEVIRNNVEAAAQRSLPEWLELNPETMEGRVKALPSRDQIDTNVKEALIVEFYSR